MIRANIPYCITDALISAAKGDVENALLFCGAERLEGDAAGDGERSD